MHLRIVSLITVCDRPQGKRFSDQVSLLMKVGTRWKKNQPFFDLKTKAASLDTQCFGKPSKLSSHSWGKSVIIPTQSLVAS